MPRGWDLGFEDETLALKWDLGLEVGIWASMGTHSQTCGRSCDIVTTTNDRQDSNPT